MKRLLTVAAMIAITATAFTGQPAGANNSAATAGAQPGEWQR